MDAVHAVLKPSFIDAMNCNFDFETQVISFPYAS